MVSIKNIIRGIFTREEIRSFIFLEVVVGLLISASSLFLFIFITNAVLLKQTVAVDSFITNLIFTSRQLWLTKIMLAFSLFGSEAIIFGSILLIIFLTLRKHRKETVIFSFLLLMGITATTSLKILYKIPRPELFSLVSETSYSYPSGHALNSLLFYGTISYFVYHFTKNKITSVIVTIISGIIVFLIGTSRVYLGVHHPSDVAAGYVAGFWLLTTTMLVDKTIIFFRFIRENSQSVPKV